MSRVRRVSVLICLVVLGVMSSPVMAQETSPFSNIGDLAGIEAAVSRSYLVDFSGQEDASMATPISEEEFAEYPGVFFMTGFVMEFGDADQAAQGYEQLQSQAATEVGNSMGDDEFTIEEAEIDGIGANAFGFTVTSQTDNPAGFFRYSFAQQESYVFMVIVFAGTDETAVEADSILAHLGNQDADFSGLGDHMPEGGSTGGLWQFFPEATDDLVSGFLPAGDTVEFPVLASAQ
ncbi:MAG: hypothetical protein M3440_03555 [Chloroflexota bacterium]|nr:hypothetical protein [Chloroflexota bacterium]